MLKKMEGKNKFLQATKSRAFGVTPRSEYPYPTAGRGFLLPEKKNIIIKGDVMKVLKDIPSDSLDCCVTSPPYWGLRDYGVEGQLGLEKTPEKYVENMVIVFREIRRVLKAEGTLWLNLGDSYAGSWGNYSGKNRGAGRQRKIKNGSRVPNPAYDGKEDWRPPMANNLGGGIKNKDLVGIPWMVAFALRTDGWYLRQDIIWNKPNPMPESVRDRCTKAHEYVFLFAKSKRYYYDARSIKTPSKDMGSKVPDGWASHKGSHTSIHKDGREKGKTWDQRKKEGEPGRYGVQSHTPSLNDTGDGWANKRSVWSVATRPFKGAHFTTFPEDLIVPMIKAGCPQGGIVFDPFIGSGTTAIVARKLGRDYLGIELNPEYIKMAKERLKKYE